MLLSGGHNEEGYVPFEPFIDAIERVKRETGIFISAHTGLMPSWLAREMGRVGVDLADFDLIGDDGTIKLVLGIERSMDDHRRALRNLFDGYLTSSPISALACTLVSSGRDGCNRDRSWFGLLDRRVPRAHPNGWHKV